MDEPFGVPLMRGSDRLVFKSQFYDIRSENQTLFPRQELFSPLL